MTPTLQTKFVPKERSQFYATLLQRVDAYFKENNIPKTANTKMVVKTIVLLSAYLLPFLVIAFYPGLPFLATLGLWLLMGFALAGIGMSVMHDSCHNAYSPNKAVNLLLGHTLNLIGGSTSNWKLQHNMLHHTFTNITYLDDDIKSKATLRFSPHTPVRPAQKFQHWAAFFFYGIMTLYWCTAKDFLQFNDYVKRGLYPGTDAERRIQLLRIIADKILYFTVFIGLPIFMGVSVVSVILGFLAMHFVAGVVLTVVFQLAHTVEETTHPMPNENGVITNDWAIHQMETTVNFSPGDGLLSWYVGGLNYQVEHHLMPGICHVHYPKLAPIVKQTAEEFGVPYLVNQTFGEALGSHIRLLKKLGTLPSLNEAIG